MKWYIDSLDPTGGLAFASWREADGDEATAFDDAAQCLFISPPSFVPEPASRSIALAARRGPFQSGFYIGEVEYGFADLEHVVDFVRRAFLGGNGSGGAPGTPGTPVPPAATPQDGGEPPRGVELTVHGGAGLADAVATFSKKIADVPFETAIPCDWETWSGPETRERPPLSMVVADALSDLEDEMLLRKAGAETQDAAGWLRSARALLAVERLVHASGLGFSSKLAPRMVYEFEEMLVLPYPYRGLMFSESPLSFDPYNALRLIPLPQKLIDALGPKVAQNVETLAQLLSLAMSSPSKIQATVLDYVADLLVLSASAIVAPEIFGPSGLAGYGSQRGPLNSRASEQLTEAALAWCASSMPRFVFPTPVEDAIHSAVGLAYSARATA